MLYWIIRSFLRPLLLTVYRPQVEGLENVPDDGGLIFASNHLSFIDSVFLPLVVSRRITFLAKQDYFTERGLKGRLKRFFFAGVGQVPIDRSGADASRAALETGKRVLAGGAILGIYPEGTRSPDGRLYRGKTGVARMAVEAGVPVLPVAMMGFFDMQPAGAMIPKRVPVTIRIGAPLNFSRYDGLQSDRFVLRSITDEIMYEIMELSGQEYVDVYAAKAKAELAAANAAPDPAADGPVETVLSGADAAYPVAKPSFALVGDEGRRLAS